jgi:hypothetical protein
MPFITELTGRWLTSAVHLQCSPSMDSLQTLSIDKVQPAHCWISLLFLLCRIKSTVVSTLLVMQRTYKCPSLLHKKQIGRRGFLVGTDGACPRASYNAAGLGGGRFGGITAGFTDLVIPPPCASMYRSARVTTSSMFLGFLSLRNRDKSVRHKQVLQFLKSTANLRKFDPTAEVSHQASNKLKHSLSHVRLNVTETHS